MSFSNTGGGTLAMPSATHGHHIDVPSAVRSMRRTLSRSSSGFLTCTDPQSSDTSRQTSPQSPCRRLGSSSQYHQLSQPHFGANAPATAPPAASTSIFTPFRSSVKLSLRSAKSSKTATPSRACNRTRAAPQSPLNRPLNVVTDSGNSLRSLYSTPSPDTPIIGQENTSSFTPRSPVPTRKSSEKSLRHSLHLDVSGSSASPQYSFLRTLDTGNHSPMHPATSSLKRSDATMNLDHSALGSPVAKRRSMHGISSLGHGEDFNILAQGGPTPPSFEIHEDSQPEYELAGKARSDRESSINVASPLPKRTSSLRKSTLQQRYVDKGFANRRVADRQNSQPFADPSTPARSRPRLSTDHFVPPMAPRESIFSSIPPLPNASAHPHEPKSQQLRHPLANTVSNSSSSVLSDNKFFCPPPPRVADWPKPNPFSISLPANATRPTAPHQYEFRVGTATPSQPNQLWRPAFHSTGLVSKVNRNPEEESQAKLAPPDTPCKKPSTVYATYPQPGSSDKKRGIRNRSSFAGISSTPFNLPAGPSDTFGKPERGWSVFQRVSASRKARRDSPLRLGSDHAKLFGDSDDFLLQVDGEGPPTPTRNGLPNSLSDLSEFSQESPSASRIAAMPVSAVRPALARQPTLSPIVRGPTPETPHELLLPLTTSRLSISFKGEDRNEDSSHPPVTPTAARDFRSSASIFVTPVNARNTYVDVDGSLYSRFEKVEQIGTGEFSTVYKVSRSNMASSESFISTTPGAASMMTKSGVFAVKKSKHPYSGHRDRDIKLREARILQDLSQAEFVVHYLDHWECRSHLYIQTEFCEEGTLDRFLAHNGMNGRLDDFRIFKILQDLCRGLKEIHDAGYMHLDMKPANILVTFEGALKIADFGLALPLSDAVTADVEGDREYMAPEMLKGRGAGTSADIFSLGLMILETAANVVLPDNGPTWIALRSGDLSEVPSLTWNPSSEISRDASGNPMPEDGMDRCDSAGVHSREDLFGATKRSELRQPPEFMVNPSNASSLDGVVKWMTAQEPNDRPSAQDVLNLYGLRWTEDHRNAPATVYEGNWGPLEVSPFAIAGDGDTEMMDV